MSDGLYTRTLGDHGSRVVLCHGLFGQGRNWTQIAKALSTDHRVLLVDMPDHGRSPWSEGFDYVGVAEQVAALLADEPAAVVGHSMGGKVAMVAALLHPDAVERLCVVDVAPVVYTGGNEFEGFVAAMRGLDLATLETRDEADARLAAAVPDPGVRAFLLQNLRRDGDAWRWQLNLDVLGDDLDTIRGWPEDAGRRSRPVRRPGAVGRRRAVRLRPRRPRRGDGALVPAGAPGDGQGRRPLGALGAPGRGRGDAAQVPRAPAPVRPPTSGGRGRPRPRCGCRRWCCRSGASGCGRGRGPRPSQVSSAQTPSRDSSSARITSIIAIAVSTVIRVVSGAVWSTAWRCQSQSPCRTSWGTAFALPSISLTIATAASRSASSSSRSTGSQAPDRLELGAVAVVATGVLEPGVERVEVGDGGQRVGSSALLASVTAAWSDTSVS